MGDVKIPNWLKGLPLAPEFHPTHTEFADPIAYISKIEKEASEFGICKIIPPLPKPSKRYVFSNLNKSLAKRPELGSDVSSENDCAPTKLGPGDGSNDGDVRAVFTTRHQELGQSVKKAKVADLNPPSGVDKQVWQSGEVYTLEQFESKSRAFARSILGTIRDVSPLVIEAMFWKAASEKPIYVEYANDVPGSAFEEPEGQLCYSHRRRRRKRNSYQRSGANSDSKKSETINSCERNSQNGEVKDDSPKIVSDTCLEVSKSSASPGIVSTDETSQSSRKKNQNSSGDMEGTAGWKLSNSPWNLQVIARSPGSLTRFMPDDIPGVTSPMVYIGMLFSWFAWHVEDHELHSMNFLHNGSSKTWYSVPGDYAFAFEELIRTEAYGGNADRLAALSLLGNKTTLMSPEVAIASGIPCCRLIQNPGEFVVTFPRAYHVGFSHGFNCGEAANFGTPQWLKVAKEAAVRRAAMNYLPMLSHQQLLYLSTMSFVSRVPRSLLPGVRSSRMRDRQKEDRELSVKKAFIEDILNENDVLSALLGKESSYRAVLWNPDLLPCASKESPIPTASAPDTNSKENATDTQCGNSTNDQNFLVDEMSLYMENLNDLYLGSDDLSSDFQVDSGTLACVACGILGFPFMSVVQPSEKASMELQPEYCLAEEFPGVSGLKNSHFSPEHCESFKGCATEDLPPISNAFPPVKDPLIPCTMKFNNRWNTVDRFLRPRSFCLEHAVETLELLQYKGGANMLVICHSDYQKIKAPAAAIAEEIGCPFNYNEVPLDIASKEDLNLIDLAVDDGRDECGEDWTSKLGINLRYCVKVRKSSSSKRVQHALALGGVFSKQSSSSEFLTVKWTSRRSRTKKVYLDAPYKQCESIEKKKEEVVEGRSSDATSFKREGKIIQYSRRNKLKPSTSTVAGRVVEHTATSKELDKRSRTASGSSIYNNGKSTSICARLDSFASNSMSEMHPVVQMLEATRDICLDSTLSQVSDTLALTAGSADAQIENHSLEERNMNSGGCNLTARESDMQEIKIPEEARENKSISPLVIARDGRFEKHKEEQKTENLNKTCGNCNLVSEGQSQLLSEEDVFTNVVSVFTKSTNLCAADSIVTCSEEQMVNAVIEKSCLNSAVCESITLVDEVQQEIQTTDGSNNKAPVSCSSTLLNDPTFTAAEGYVECPRDAHISEAGSNVVSSEFKPEEDIKIPKGRNEEPSLSHTGPVSQPSPASTDGSSGVPRELYAAADFRPGPISHSEEFQAADRSSEGEYVSTSMIRMEETHPSFSLEESSDVPRGSSLEESTSNGVTSAIVVQQDAHTTNEAMEAPSHNFVVRGENQPLPVSVEDEIPRVTCATDATLDDKEQGTISYSNKKLIASHDTSKCEPSRVTIKTYFRVKRGTRAAQELLNGSEVCISHDRELENIESSIVDPTPSPQIGSRRKRGVEQNMDDNFNFNGFIRGPCERLRPRAGKDATISGIDIHNQDEEKPVAKKVKRPSDVPVPPKDKKKEQARKSHSCNLGSCRMSFHTKEELMVHKRNRCPHEGCGKKFSCHKYAMVHSRVHENDRPFKCPWKGCSMSFKWAWAQTEHIRVHTGEKPYKCKVDGCGLSFRFVSDFSRHRRKTGHYVS